MQNAKDSFYMALRTRLAAINPERTILLRGAVRPGILVEEAEAPFSQLPNDVFVLRWLGLGVDMDLGVHDGGRGVRNPLPDVRNAELWRAGSRTGVERRWMKNWWRCCSLSTRPN